MLHKELALKREANMIMNLESTKYNKLNLTFSHVSSLIGARNIIIHCQPSSWQDNIFQHVGLPKDCILFHHEMILFLNFFHICCIEKDK